MTKLEKNQRCGIAMAGISEVTREVSPLHCAIVRLLLLLVDVIFDGLEEVKAAVERSK